MEIVSRTLNTFVDQTLFVKDNLDYDQLTKDVLNSEILYFSILYLASKPLLFKLPDDVRRAYLTPFLKLYNAAMSLFSFGCFLAMAKALTEVDGFGDCDAPWENPYFSVTAKLFFYSKFVEYIDSWSLVLAGKKVTFLQSFHHLGAPWALFFLIQYKAHIIWIFVLLNSLVHTVMYAYYCATLFKLKFALKPLITCMQIVQFNVGFYILWGFKDLPCHGQNPGRMLGHLYNYYYVLVVLILFLNFSLWTYVFPRKSSSSGKEKAN